MNSTKKFKKVFILGIKGAAMANIALILKKMGIAVTGSDKEEEFITDEQLVANKISVIHSFEASALPHDIDLVIFSAAHGGLQNPQVIEAQKRGIAVMHQVELIGDVLKEFTASIAVCGTHGKTTSSGMLAYCLLKLNADPSYLVGTSKFNEYNGGDFNGKKYFVIEADEYGLNPPHDVTPKLQYLYPTHCIATNIDFDHPDVYADIASTKETFKKFFHQVSQKLYVCIDDADLMSVIQEFPKSTYQTFGFDAGADLQIIKPVMTESKTSFELLYKSKSIGTFTLSLFGGKHISNAAGVILALLDLGFSADKIRKVISGYGGAKRRFEFVKKVDSQYLFDDYAHHPTEILSTIQTAKERFKNRRVIVIFQPHTFSRTESLKDQFIDSLSMADYVFIAPIFASAREKSGTHSITSENLVTEAHAKSHKHFYAYSSKEDLVNKLAGIIQESDVIFTMGAGDVYKLKNDIIGVLKNYEKPHTS